MRRELKASTQAGTALIAAIFLIVVVAMLGVFASRLANSQSYATRLQLLQMRAELAASTGLEYAANRVQTGAANCVDVPLVWEGFAISVTCIGIPTGAPVVFELRSTASSGVYGQPEFVQRTRSRTVTGIGTGNW